MHLVVLAVVAVIALVLIGVTRWRGKRAAKTAEEQSASAPDDRRSR